MRGRKSATAAAITTASAPGAAWPSARSRSAALSNPTRVTRPRPGATAGVPGPARNVTSAPRATAAAASAAPILPDERFPMNRTSSMGSRVGPAVTTTRRPVRSPGASSRAAAAAISAGSMRRPAPTQPHASAPRSGPTVEKRPPPSPSRRARLAWVSGFSHMFTFIAGASSTGPRPASTTAASRSSAIPAARRAMLSAVAGAITTRSASSARRMWPISASLPRSKRSRDTGLPDSACSVSGVMNWVAASVMTTRTEAPALTSNLQSSAPL